jgi:hypothetical protein
MPFRNLSQQGRNALLGLPAFTVVVTIALRQPPSAAQAPGQRRWMQVCQLPGPQRVGEPVGFHPGAFTGINGIYSVRVPGVERLSCFRPLPARLRPILPVAPGRTSTETPPLSSRSTRFSVVLAAVAAALLLAAGLAVHHERERRKFDGVVASGRAALSARVPGTAQCAAAVDWLAPRLAEQGEQAPEAAWRVVAECAMLSGRRLEAVTAYRALADRAPREAGPQLDLSRALTRAGRHTEAVDAARRALGLAPQAWQAERGLALAAAGAGDLDTAVAALERARAFAPVHERPALERQLADLAARRGRAAPAAGGDDGQAGR